ncbi:MAG: hypothetical protein VYC76_07840 [Pseudomonadota bacterium]|nr:hypothetical protein [Pseudomonadota bacterium]
MERRYPEGYDRTGEGIETFTGLLQGATTDLAGGIVDIADLAGTGAAEVPYTPFLLGLSQLKGMADTYGSEALGEAVFGKAPTELRQQMRDDARLVGGALGLTEMATARAAKFIADNGIAPFIKFMTGRADEVAVTPEGVEMPVPRTTDQELPDTSVVEARSSRPTDRVRDVDLGGGTQGVAGLAHGVSTRSGSPNFIVRMDDLDKLDPSFDEQKQKLLNYASENNLFVQDGNILIDRADFVALMGLDNRVRTAFIPKNAAAKSAEIGREGFSVSGDPYLSFVNFAGESGKYQDLDNLLVAETKGLTRKDVQDLSPAEYLMAQYDPDAKVLKKPNTKFFEDESHFGKDSGDYSTMRRLTDQERNRFNKIADNNKAAMEIAGQAMLFLRDDKADIFDVARSTRDAFNKVQGVHAERMVELSVLARLAEIFDDPNPTRKFLYIDRIEDSLGENGVAELANVAKAYKVAREKVVGDDNLNKKVFEENAEVLKEAYREDLAQFPDFANGLTVKAAGEKGRRYTRLDFDPEFTKAMFNHAAQLQKMETADGFELNSGMADLKARRKAALEESTANLKKHPLYKRFTFEDPKTGRLKFRAMQTEDQIKYPDVIKLNEDINEALFEIDKIRTGKTTTEATLDFINSTIPTSFAGPLKQLAKNARTIEERVRTNINKRPRAAEFNQAYRDYNAATKAFVDHLSRIADQGRQSPLSNYMDKSGPETKFKDITVRDNPAVKFEDGGPVRAGIAEFIPLIQKGSEGRPLPNFVRRTLDPKSPMTEKGSTVRLMDFEYGGKFFVSPTIFPMNSPQGPRLTELPEDMAIRYALETGEFLQFDTPEEAASFAEGYSGTINMDRPKQAGIANFIKYMQ